MWTAIRDKLIQRYETRDLQERYIVNIAYIPRTLHLLNSLCGFRISSEGEFWIVLLGKLLVHYWRFPSVLYKKSFVGVKLERA